VSEIVVLGRLRPLLLLVGLVFAGLPAGSALADTTIGQLGGNTTVGAGGVGFWVADPSYGVPPGGGTITSFSFQAGPENPGEQLDFLVLRPAGLDTYTLVGKTGLVTLTGTLTGTKVETFPADIAVQGGDVLGLWTRGPLDDIVDLGGSGSVVLSFQHSDPNVGDGIFLGGGAGPPISLNESANLAPPLPTSEDQCMQDGWKSFGSTFKNRGDCVSFVATHGKNPPG
jgi:hypothetical protein